jgi:hypothetical protein
MSKIDFDSLNKAYVQALYEDFARNPDSVPPEWREFFSEERGPKEAGLLRPEAFSENGAPAAVERRTSAVEEGVGQRGRVVDVLGVGTNGTGQGALLGTGLLVRRVEVRLYLRVLAKHARVKMARQGLAVRLQGGDGLFYNGYGFRLEHACSPGCTI